MEDDDEPDEDDNSWAGWAAKQQRQAAAVLGGAAESVGQTVQSGWDTVNDAHRRDQVSVSVGHADFRSLAVSVVGRPKLLAELSSTLLRVFGLLERLHLGR